METDLRRIATDIFVTALKIWPEENHIEGVKFAVERAKEIVEQCGGESIVARHNNLLNDYEALRAKYVEALVKIDQIKDKMEATHGK